MAGLNRDTDGFIQPTGRKCSFSRTFLSMSLTPPGCLSPAVEDTNKEKLKPGRNLLTVQEVGDLGDERMEGDREDEMRQGGTLTQRGVRKRVKRVMLNRGLPLPISSHYYFILPSVCTSHPHFPLCFLCCAHFLSDLLGGKSSMGQDTKGSNVKGRAGYQTLTPVFHWLKCACVENYTENWHEISHQIKQFQI